MNTQVQDFIYRLGEFQIRVGLEETKKFMKILGEPYLHQNIIHIAGTNGKGSTISFLEKLLLDSGFSVGTTTSPHLLSYRERFRFQGMPISHQELNEVFEEICEKCNINPSQSFEKWLVQPTFFEFSIGLAFYWFQKKNPDFILLETGMGGRLDSTNIIKQSLVCGFTTISWDHSEFLGNSLLKIAKEKFGIIKPKSKIVSTRQKKNVEAMLKKQFPNHQKTLLNQDFFISQKKGGYFFKTKIQKEKICLTLNKLGLVGDHQVENAALALEIYLQLVSAFSRLSNEKIAKSLSCTRWVGRLQYLKKKTPPILLEAAHNKQGVKVLGKYLKKNHSKQKILCVIHWLKTKDIIQQLQQWDLENIVFQPVDFCHPKANDSQIIYQDLCKITKQILPPTSLKTMIKSYNKNQWVNYDLFLVTGSIYLLGEYCSNLIKQGDFSKEDFYGI